MDKTYCTDSDNSFMKLHLMILVISTKNIVKIGKLLLENIVKKKQH